MILQQKSSPPCLFLSRKFKKNFSSDTVPSSVFPHHVNFVIQRKIFDEPIYVTSRTPWSHNGGSYWRSWVNKASWRKKKGHKKLVSIGMKQVSIRKRMTENVSTDCHSEQYFCSINVKSNFKVWIVSRTWKDHSYWWKFIFFLILAVWYVNACILCILYHMIRVVLHI